MHMISLVRKYSAAMLLLLLLTIGSIFAYHNAFMQDDAYIAFRYSKHFSEGLGLVWEEGSTEFGFTNFLYTLMIGIAMKLGAHPETASNAINYCSFIGALLLTYNIAKRLLENAYLALLPVLLLATHHSFTSYATGGLETMFVSFLWLLFYWRLITREEHPKWALHLGIIASISLLTRLDSSVFLLPGYVYLFWVGGKFRSLWPLRFAILLPTIAVTGLLLHCYLTYGNPLPNSFYIKTPQEHSMFKYGLRYLWLYNKLHLYLPLGLPIILTFFYFRRSHLRSMDSLTFLLASVVVLWGSYMVYVGGDFMEFRFFVPMLALYYITFLYFVKQLLTRYHKALLLLFSAMFIAGNYMHVVLFYQTKPNVYDTPEQPARFIYAFVENTEMLHDWLHHDKVGWITIGKKLGELFADDRDIKIALMPSGAISYYSELSIFDLLGLNSRIVRENHAPMLPRAGHAMRARGLLLLQERVNLNIEHPETLCKRNGRFELTENLPEKLSYKRKETILLPIGSDCYLLASYMSRHPRIEALLEDGTIQRHDDIARFSDCPHWLCPSSKSGEMPESQD